MQNKLQITTLIANSVHRKAKCRKSDINTAIAKDAISAKLQGTDKRNVKSLIRDAHLRLRQINERNART